MYITEHNQQFRFILPLIERYNERINFKTRRLEDIITGRYFQDVLTLSKTNSYCRTKCNAHKKKIRQKMVLYHKNFDLRKIQGSSAVADGHFFSHTL